MKKYISFVVITLCISLKAYSAYMDTTIIEEETAQSLYIEVYFNNMKLGSATGFVIKSKTQYYLVTNWHVLTCKNPYTKKWLDGVPPLSPNKLVIHYNGKKLGKHISVTENLYDDDKPRWHEDSLDKRMVDVVELPLKDTINAGLYPINYDVDINKIIRLKPTERIFVIGFPLGISFDNLPIWKSGLIASEPSLNPDGLPVTVIDEMPYHGMSGSPAYFISEMYYNDDTKVAVAGHTSVFIGVLSGGMDNVSLTVLWKGDFLRKIFNTLP